MNLDTKKFGAWLQAQGAQVLAPTNGWEVARFKARGAVHVVYRDRRGSITAHGFAGDCVDAFERGANLGMGFSVRRQTLSWKVKQALLERDGDACFFCAKPVTHDDITVEHLVAVGKGGPSHMDNLALAHDRCNKDVDNLPLMEKIRIYARARSGVPK